ncbi:MAG: OmpA family protein [Betaproteobacteria bacterium]|nr:OmpA family protein [Betaproteobacteria bacterium]MBV9361700.1 OmpA family protein [Betaproteobacteria bacterium]
MEKQILAVLIAALAGGAYAQVASAQSNYTTSNAVTKSTSPQPAGATARIGSPPPAPGYVGSGAGVVATSPFGLCWHGGAEWTPDKAAAPCDMTPTASAPVAPVAAAPAPAPEPQALAAAPAAPVIEKITLNTDVLFPFNSAELLPGGQTKLDQLAQDAQGANVDRVVLTGHADRIGSEDYNQQLSEERAQAVADYLAQKGVDSSRITAEGKGKSEPVTGSECNNLGKDSNKNQKLIACLQPDRRVDAELLGSRDSTASTGSSSTSSAGSTSNSSSTGSASGSSSSESGSTTNK